MMKKTRRNRIIIALVLLMSLLPMVIVKATHFHDSASIVSIESSETSHSHSGAADNDCPVCQFFMSPFVEVTESHFEFTATLLGYILVSPCTGSLKSASQSAALRAPPAAFQA